MPDAMKRERQLWFSLVTLAMMWGAATGVAFARDTWLNPITAVYGCMGIWVLAVTLWVAATSAPRTPEGTTDGDS